MTARRRGEQSRQGAPSGGLPGEGHQAATPAGPGDERRVRYTLDLSREQHRFLKYFAFDAGTDASVVMRALLALLQNDERVARRVRSEVERESR